MGYGNPKTLSDTSVRGCKGDIREFKPTILVGVPAVWESVRKGIIANVDKSNPVIKNMFWGALATKSMLLSMGLPGSGVLDAVVFKKIKEATGGRLKLCMNGGGPIAKEIWLRGDSIIDQYFENEEETAEAITSDGWFKTGDIGEWDPNGHLRLIDRKKNLVKTLNGEYIALEKVRSST